MFIFARPVSPHSCSLNRWHEPYSSEENCLHISYEAGKLEELTTNGIELVEFGMCVTPMAAPDKPETITIDFESGVPIRLNGQRKIALEMVKEFSSRDDD